MIYEFPDQTAPLRQGDIFIGLPRIDISLQRVVIADPQGERLARWAELASHNQALNIIVPVRPVAAIVATQDCDATRGRDITLCEIQKFRDVERKAKDTQKAKSWVNILTQHARINQKWFYLPPDERIGFADKMAVDFIVTLRVPRAELEALRDLRRGRLNAVADEHFWGTHQRLLPSLRLRRMVSAEPRGTSSVHRRLPGLAILPLATLRSRTRAR